ncbi:hypothetical protein ACFZ8E_21305 [Methylobacterium sp. HMF5984]|uniref:beta family protein n=1 Tax=Methylobacterium sp. HMF5984 TaxID=3367370 RepID=UPI003851E300
MAIAANASAKGLDLIPAISLASPAGYSQAVHTIVQTQGRGIALRIDLNEFSSAASWVGGWNYPLSETDLIVDLQDSVGTVASLGSTVQHTFSNLHQGATWRSVTIAGTSMPPNFAAINQGPHLITRSEYSLWFNLQAVVPYRLDFGDYTTPPIVEPPSGMTYGFPINVRYNLASEFLICKGVRTRGINSVMQDVQLTGHANSIINYANRGLISGCWADDEIDQIGAGKSPQTLAHWVKIGVNRHVVLTRQVIP